MIPAVPANLPPPTHSTRLSLYQVETHYFNTPFDVLVALANPANIIRKLCTASPCFEDSTNRGATAGGMFVVDGQLLLLCVYVRCGKCGSCTQ